MLNLVDTFFFIVIDWKIPCSLETELNSDKVCESLHKKYVNN